MADGNWYSVGATRVLGCTQCTCEARDYVYCVDLCPGKYTNATKQKLLKSVNYQVLHFPPLHSTPLLQYLSSNNSSYYVYTNFSFLQFSEINVK